MPPTTTQLWQSSASLSCYWGCTKGVGGRANLLRQEQYTACAAKRVLQVRGSVKIGEVSYTQFWNHDKLLGSLCSGGVGTLSLSSNGLLQNP